MFTMECQFGYNNKAKKKIITTQELLAFRRDKKCNQILKKKKLF